MSVRVGRLPIDDQSNGWSALLPPRRANAEVRGELDFDWVVVGAGYAGVAAARQLARLRPNATIALVEAGLVGENASGRNSGFAIDLPHAAGTSEEWTEQGRSAIRVGRFALNELDCLVKEHSIDCGWEKRGRYHVAVTENVAKRSLAAYEASLKVWQEPYRWVDRSELREALGTAYYAAAIHTPGTYLVNPASLIRGLADSLPRQVKLFENSPVIEAEIRGQTPSVRTPHGRIRANALILTVNAFSQSFGVYRTRQIPILLFASLTPALSDEQLGQLGRESTWGLTPAHSVVGSTLRLTRERRLMIRQGFEYSPSLGTTDARRAKAREINLALLRRRFPQLGPIELEHFWAGWLAVSHNHAPAFGRVGPNSFAASCCNGSGIVRHTAAGTFIADLALGRDHSLMTDFLSQGTANYIPPRPLRDIGVGMALSYGVWTGRGER